MYKYGLIFWNEKTDEEYFCYIEASDYFSAEKIFEAYPTPQGFVTGDIHYIESCNEYAYQAIENIYYSKIAKTH